MFENLTDKITDVFSRLGNKGRLTESDVDQALREIRLALLDADVHFRVARSLVTKIKEKVMVALKSDMSKCSFKMPNSFIVEIDFKKPSKAYRNSFYTGMKQVSDTRLVFEAKEYFEVLRMLVFVLSF